MCKGDDIFEKLNEKDIKNEIKRGHGIGGKNRMMTILNPMYQKTMKYKMSNSSKF